MRNRNKAMIAGVATATAMTLVLPGVAEARGPSDVRVVQRGDTLSSIAPENTGHVCVVNVAEHRITGCDTLEVGNIVRVNVTDDEISRVDRLVEEWQSRQPPPPPPPPAPTPAPAPAPEPAPQAPSSGSGGYAIPYDIVMCESGGDYSAENPTSSASGAYQITDGTWNGYGGYSHASDAPPHIQDERAAQIWDGGAGRSNWVC